jgi:hypothetical protein
MQDGVVDAEHVVERRDKLRSRENEMIVLDKHDDDSPSVYLRTIQSK